jgi:hypothetical protein
MLAALSATLKMLYMRLPRRLAATRRSSSLPCIWRPHDFVDKAAEPTTKMNKQAVLVRLICLRCSRSLHGGRGRQIHVWKERKIDLSSLRRIPRAMRWLWAGVDLLCLHVIPYKSRPPKRTPKPSDTRLAIKMTTAKAVSPTRTRAPCEKPNLSSLGQMG